VLAVAGGYAAWTQFGHSGAATPPSAPTPSGSASRAAAPPSAPITVQQPSPAPVAPSLATQPVPEKTKTLPPPSQTHSGKASPAIESSKPPAAAVEENKSPATSQPIVIRKQTPAAQSAPSNDAPVAITGIAPSAGSPALPNLLSNQTSAPAPILQTLSVSQGVSQGLVIKKTSPSYPTNALRMRIEGSVQLLATISKKGDISSVKIISGDPSLARSAVDAVKQWKYKPYLLDGTPVEIQTQITVNFKLPR
jgi:protein TonB